MGGFAYLYITLARRRPIPTRPRALLALCVAAVVLLLAPAADSFAQSPEEQPEPPLCQGRPMPPEFAAAAPPGDANVYVTADEATAREQGTSSFFGNVIVQQQHRALRADEAHLDQPGGLLDAAGNVTFTDGDLILTGERAHLEFEQNRGHIERANYASVSSGARGEAERIDLLNDYQLRLSDATYTTCDPGDRDWMLHGGEINLDQQTRQGTATHVWLEFMHVPFLYLPYIRFPIGDERMSGLLFPTVGVSDSLGTELAVPFYWNIAPNMDATLTPYYMSKRGTMLENEFRYLTEHNAGVIDYRILPDDDVFGDKRELIKWAHNGQPDQGWSTAVDYNYVSDVEYLDDFGGNLSATSLTHLDRKGQLAYNTQYWRFNSLAQDFQTLSGTQPYKRLPQLTFNTRLPNPENKPNYFVDTEYVRFDHRDESKLVGERIKLMPAVSYPLSNAAMFFTPKLTLHHLAYNLDEATLTTGPEKPSVTVPVYSLDAGIFLERDSSLGGVPLLQTLEPRLFYVYAPLKDQSELPVFDTALTTFSQSRLFTENRFTGNDRIGDANRLTVALTTRLLRQDSGAEVFSGTLGQIAYFDDREVTLPGQAVQTQNRSDIIGLLSVQPLASLRVSGDIQWDPDTRHTQVGNARIQFQPSAHTVVNMGYRFRREQLRTRELSFGWRVSPRWQLFGGQQYDLENDRNLESFFGVHYQSCCWGIRVMARDRFDRLDEATGEPLTDQAVYIELELKGLSSFGQSGKMDQILLEGVPGYTP